VPFPSPHHILKNKKIRTFDFGRDLRLDLNASCVQNGLNLSLDLSLIEIVNG
jgi:hypothetical protein